MPRMVGAEMNAESARAIIKDFLELRDKKKPLLVLTGPTASGKTALSLDLARQFNGEIISADSRQIYRYMGIGTDKIPVDKRQGIAHHLIDVVSPDERFTVGDFKRRAEAVIDAVHARGKLPMVVGGTGFYIQTLTDNLVLPSENLLLREELIKELEKKGADALHARLAKLDPASAAKIHPANIRYLVRALEVVMGSGKPRSIEKNPSRYRILKIGLRLPRELLFERIEGRVDEQMKRGLLEETSRLLEMGFSKNLSSMTSLGYREMIAHLEGALTLEGATALLKQNTRNYAKRQLTWFKRDGEIVWVDGVS